MLSCSMASQQKTLPVGATATMWEFFVNGLKRAGQWYSPSAFLWNFSLIKFLVSFVGFPGSEENVNEYPSVQFQRKL